MKKRSVVPRILGIILLVIAGVNIYRFGVSVSVFGFASILLLVSAFLFILGSVKKNQVYLTRFLKSLTDEKFMLIAFIETLFYFGVFGLTYLLGLYIRYRIQIAQGVRFDPAGFISDPLLDTNVSLVQNLAGFALGSITVWVILMVLIWTILKGIQWLMISERAVTINHLKRYFFFNLIWLGFWTTMSLFLMVAVESQTAAIPLVIMYVAFIHLNGVINACIARSGKIREGLAEGFNLGVTQIHKFIIPYNYAFLTYFVILQPLQFITGKFLLAAYVFLIVIFYFTWTKIYVMKVVEELEE